MRRWFPRVLWLGAWSFWAWLGWGLYRELPRQLVPPIAAVPHGSDVSPIGFIGDGNRFALMDTKARTSSDIQVYDAETGTLACSAQGPIGNDYLWPDYFQARRSILFAKDVPAKDGSDGTGLHLLDLTTGQWRRISPRKVHRGSPHESKPWVVIVENEGRSQRPGRVVLIDWETGREVVLRDLDPRESLNGRVFFLSSLDAVAIPISRRPWTILGIETSAAKESVEVWQVGGEKPVLSKALADVPVGLFPSISATGRVAFAFPYETASIDVYDFNDDRYLLSDPPRDQRSSPPPSKKAASVYPPVISANGTRVLGGKPTTLRDVDTGAVVWRSAGSAFVERPRNLISEMENWNRLWKTWVPKGNYITHAVREMDTGHLVWRTGSKPIVQSFFWNAAGTLGIGNDGNVYRLPPRVNYFLLALCQTILALPLVLTWLVLRWQRKRRLRMAGARS